MLLRISRIIYRNTVYFGVNSISKLGKILKSFKERGIDRVLIVTGRKSYKESGAWNHVKEALESSEIEYSHYDKVLPNPTIEMVEEGLKELREFGAKGLLAIGGGSAIDVAKGIAAAARSEKPPRELYLGGKAKEALPLIAINLTHGTGSEVDRYSVVTIPELKYKLSIGGEAIYPQVSFDDPLLTFTLDPEQTKYVTIDAFCHALEAGTSKYVSPLSWTLSKESISLILNYIGKAVREGKNLEARYYLMYAAMIAGISFDNSPLHIIHAMEHPISAIRPEISHGLGLAVLLPAVIEKLYSFSPDEVSALLAPMIEKGMSPKEVREKVVGWLSSLKIPTSLGEIGIGKDDIPELVRLVFETPYLEFLVKCFPAEVVNEEEFIRELYFSSL